MQPRFHGRQTCSCGLRNLLQGHLLIFRKHQHFALKQGKLCDGLRDRLPALSFQDIQRRADESVLIQIFLRPLVAPPGEGAP